MAAYFTSQGYDAPPDYIWAILTDFGSWPAWFPRMSEMRLVNGAAPGRGAELLATGLGDDEWTRWQIVEWSEPTLLVCEYVDSNVPISHGVQAAYLQFGLFDEPEGCTLEVEFGAEGVGLVGDFFVGMTLGTSARRLLPQLVDAFSDHVVQRATSP
jgi:hypothetical protein